MRFSLFCLLLSGFALAHPPISPPEMPKEFNQLKNLVGTWEGTTKMGDKEEKLTLTYELTSGGTALVEKMNAGTPQEMTTVYHKEGKSLGMTHFCLIGNQPHLMLKKADEKTMTFEMTKPIGLTSPKEEHMHALTLTWENADTVKQEWTNYKDGKKQGTVTFTLNRQKKG